MGIRVVAQNIHVSIDGSVEEHFEVRLDAMSNDLAVHVDIELNWVVLMLHVATRVHDGCMGSFMVSLLVS